MSPPFLRGCRPRTIKSDRYRLGIGNSSAFPFDSKLGNRDLRLRPLVAICWGFCTAYGHIARRDHTGCARITANMDEIRKRSSYWENLTKSAFLFDLEVADLSQIARFTGTEMDTNGAECDLTRVVWLLREPPIISLG